MRFDGGKILLLISIKYKSKYLYHNIKAAPDNGMQPDRDKRGSHR